MLHNEIYINLDEELHKFSLFKLWPSELQLNEQFNSMRLFSDSHFDLQQ